MTGPEMAQLAAVMTARWPKAPRTGDWAKAWLSAFADYAIGDALRCLDTLDPQGSSPEGHELLAALRDGGVSADGLVADVMFAVRRRGSLRPMRRDEWRSEAVADTIEAWGGWMALCQEHDLREPATRAQFRDAIRARLADRRAAGLPLLNPAAPVRLALPAPPVFDDEPEAVGEFVPATTEFKEAYARLVAGEKKMR